MPPEMVRCSTCGKTYKSIQALCDHEDKCKSPEKLGRNAAGQEEALSSAQCGHLGLNVPDNNDNPAFDDAWGSNNDALGFGMPKQKQPSLTEPEQKLDVVEAPQPLQEQLGEDTTSVDEPGTDSPGDKSATDNSDEVLTSCSEKSSPSLTEPEQKLDVVEAPQPLQEQLGEDTTSDDEPGTDSPVDGSAADDSHRDTICDDDPRTDSPGDKSAANDSDEVLTSDSEKSLCSVECHGGGERTGNLQDVMEVYVAAHILLMLKSATETACSPSLTEPEQKLDVVEAPQPLQEQLGEDTTSYDEPGTDSPGDGSAADDSHRDTTSDDDPRTDSPGDKSAADDSDEVLTSDSEKSLCSVECHGGGERTGNLQDVMEVYGAAHSLLMLKSATETAYGDPIGGIEKGENGAPVVKVELSCTDDSQGVSDRSEKPAVSELKRPKLDPEVLHDSAATEEKKQKIDLDAPAPTNSSGEERSDVTDSQTSQST